MSKQTQLSTETPWLRIEASEEDWKAEDPTRLAAMLEQVLLVRRFEERLLELKNEDLLHGPPHASIGQEAAAVGAMSVLGTGDKINGTHRMHHQFLAKALTYASPDGYDPLQGEFPETMQDVVYRTMAEILGLTPGYTGGRGGSMHLKWDACGAFGSNAIVGGNPPHAVGYAFADNMRGNDNISVTFFGDGAMQIGASYESMNLAALYDLPVVFFCENNLYAVSTHVREQTREIRLSGRGLGLAIPGLEVDGMDPIAVRLAMRWARDHIRDHAGPVLIEALTYRYLHQSGGLSGSAFGYRTKKEEAEWSLRDPVTTMPQTLTSLRILDDAAIEVIHRRVSDVVERATTRLVEQDKEHNIRRIIPSLWPDPKTVDYGIRGDLSELVDVPEREVGDIPADKMREMKFVEAISYAIALNMARDQRVFVLGEDVHRLRGGTAGATKGVVDKYPDRVVGTPICENGFTGLAIGAALNGLRPIVEIMYPDFCLIAADQLFNQAAKVRHMFGGDFPMPLVCRSRVSAGTGYGSQHSMDASSLFALYPGWRIVIPSTPFDYVGLMNASIRCDDPVLIVEYQDLFQTSGPVPEQEVDFIVPFGKARIARPGSDCTVLTYGISVVNAEKAAEETGIDAEIIDLRTLDIPGLDWDTIGESVRRTNRVVIAEQTTRGTSLGPHLATQVHERLFDWLDHEVVRVSGTLSSPVVSKVLERAALAGTPEIAAGYRSVMGYDS